MTPSLSTPAVDPSAERLRIINGAEFAQATLAILRDLEASLQSSQKALLSRDIAAVEQGTSEQARLVRALEILCPARASVNANGPVPENDCASPGLCSEPALLDELRVSKDRVLHLTRVHAALLSRERQFLTLLSNLMAGPDARYVAPRGRDRVASGWASF